jgi:hypothetical protein
MHSTFALSMARKREVSKSIWNRPRERDRQTDTRERERQSTRGEKQSQTKRSSETEERGG